MAATPAGDERVLAALLHASWGGSYARRLGKLRRLPGFGRKKALFLRVFERMEFYDLPLRAFEHAGLTFELTVSASCYAQLKRHRMATLTAQAYDPGLGGDRSPSIEAAGEASWFRDVIGRDRSGLPDPKGGRRSGRGLRSDQRPPPPGSSRPQSPGAHPSTPLSARMPPPSDIRPAADVGRRPGLVPLAAMLLCGKDAYPDVHAKISSAARRTRRPRPP